MKEIKKAILFAIDDETTAIRVHSLPVTVIHAGTTGTAGTIGTTGTTGTTSTTSTTSTTGTVGTTEVGASKSPGSRPNMNSTEST